MAYYRFAIRARGFTRDQLREIKRAMKTWPRFYAVFHDEKEDIVPLNKRVKTRFWMEISDEPINDYKRSWADELAKKEDERMKAHLKWLRAKKG
jgi:hypothetical protein